MPLYLEKISVTVEDSLHSQAVWNALLTIQSEVAELRVSPRMAWKMACLYLRPMLLVEHQDVFTPDPHANWDTMLIAYAELLDRSKGDDIHLINVATAIRIVYQHTTHPPREEASAPLLEVMYFFQMCDHVKSPLNRLCGEPGREEGELFRFCKYCWKTAIKGRLICYEHASLVIDESAKVSAAMVNEIKTIASRRKQANRQKRNFDIAISRMMTKEVMEFHESEFMADVLLPKSGRMEWLARRRPRVAQLLIETGVEVTDVNISEHLLTLLHDSEPLQGIWRSTYARVNTTIIQTPELIWPILARAESWLLARELIQKNWGGKRPNSGRKKLSSDG